ncbi:flagellar assembly protein FliH (plasmid) [Enterobacter asburiae]|jgi:flagellar assembly protein FliH|uniref:flagellar assembly protein FliH n=1 Tax=Enterobacter asburiae TaxID=61645 RepID=UPI0029331085|nr:flagellar assembly protein FliH [Enterobacter asburiae]EMA4739814.1 flagellar assembly protein FliH [Enterobacter asburiae]
MSNPEIAWQRWQPQDLQQPFSPPEPIAGPASDAVGQRPSQESLQAELALRQQNAEQQGFVQGKDRGYDEGKRLGYQDGLVQGKQEAQDQYCRELQINQAAIAERFERLFQGFQAALDNLDSVIPSRLVQLALTAARMLIGDTPPTDHVAMLAQIKSQLKADMLLRGELQLWVSEETYDEVEQFLGESIAAQGWTLHGDASLVAGGWRIATAEGELDATMATRWAELCSLAKGSNQL